MACVNIILSGGKLPKKRTRKEILFIDLQIQSPKSGNNFIVPLDWSSPVDPARGWRPLARFYLCRLFYNPLKIFVFLVAQIYSAITALLSIFQWLLAL